jgi:hypothetical protein
VKLCRKYLEAVFVCALIAISEKSQIVADDDKCSRGNVDLRCCSEAFPRHLPRSIASAAARSLSESRRMM